MSASWQSTLVNIFTSDAIDVAELVSTATVALVGAVDVCTLLAAGVRLTLIHIFTRPAIRGQFES